MTEMLDNLDERMQELTSNTPRLDFKLSEINSPEMIIEARKVLDMYGVLFITDAIEEEQVPIIQNRLIDAHNEMYDMHGCHASSIEEVPMKAKAGVMGNKGFAYLYKQPMKKSLANKLVVETHHGYNEVYVDHNPVYSKVNLATLTDLNNRRMLSVLLGLTHPIDTMVSWDSAKVSYNHKSGANSLTAPHIDYYNDITERVQVILNAVENRTKLFYIPNTLDPMVKELMEKIEKKPGLYKDNGFKRLNDKTVKVLKKYAVAPPPRSLIFWKSGIVHAEWTAGEEPVAGLYHPDEELSDKPLTKQLTVRLVVGTHKPTGLTNFARKQLAVAAQLGIIPHRYLHGKHEKVVMNKMHKGKTLYKKNRVQPEVEKNLMTRAIMKLEDPEWVIKKFDRLDPIVKHLSGVRQEGYFFSSVI